MIYGREHTITLDEVLTAIKTKESQRSSELPESSRGESLNVKSKFGNYRSKKAGESDKPKFQKSWKTNESKESRTCHHCKKVGHIKKNCFMLKRKME